MNEQPSKNKNRLACESSPYLLQHQTNPVDWYPWGEEALKKSKAEDKPIFLSVGYSACHWCHVMEHESFEDPAIAQFLNENFVSIKVDREERPDIDQIYMNAVMAMRGGGGGWPLSVFLTPDQQAFFGGTYWPPQPRMGMPGFGMVLQRVVDAFANQRKNVTDQAGKITEWLNQNPDLDVSAKPELILLEAAIQAMKTNFDYDNGGFGGAPKFPHATDLRFMTAMSNVWDDKRPPKRSGILELVRISCKKMAYGGIFDHLAGGFARYSVDEKWLVPHFEKMLYDNSQLVDVYLDMSLATGDIFFQRIAEKTLEYTLGYLTDDQGAFYSTEDADSEGVEGKFYVWSKQEIVDTLGDQIGERFCRLYNVTPSGNFEGHNILNMTKSYQEFADAEGIDKQQLRGEMKDSREKLLAIRDQRIRPGLDDKVVVSWNGLMIHAMARAGVVTGNYKYGEAASKAADFIWNHVRSDDGRLLHTWRHGKAKLGAYLDDYAFYIDGLLEVYQFDFDGKWIDRAAELTEQMVSHFADTDGSGFFFTADDHEKLIARSKSFQDSSIPSGNGMATQVLLRLGRLLGRTEWLEIAEKTICTATGLMQKSPLACGQMLIATQNYLDDSKQYVLVGGSLVDLNEPLEIIRKTWRPNSMIVCCSAAHETGEALSGIVKDKIAVDGQPTLYICNAEGCLAPVVGIDSMAKAL